MGRKTFDFETNKATPQWLTAVLRNNGFLSDGEVTSIKQKAILKNKSFVSAFHSLSVNYAKGSTPSNMGESLPSNFVIKILKRKYYSEKEINFYQIAPSKNSPLPFITCYGTEKSPKTKQGYILLADLTLSHHQTDYALPPFIDECKDAIASLARLHAYWWNHSDLKKFQLEHGYEFPTAEVIQNIFLDAQNRYVQFQDFLGDRLSESRKKTYSLIFDKASDLFCNRYRSCDQLTLVHGDSHFWNFLYPNNRDLDQCVLFDWEAWGIALATRDLTYLIALHWHPEQRERLEIPLLKHYLHELEKLQIDYSWDELYTDYRLYVIFMLLIPVFYQTLGRASPTVWWYHLDRAFAAFNDLDCIELLC